MTDVISEIIDNKGLRHGYVDFLAFQIMYVKLHYQSHFIICDFSGHVILYNKLSFYVDSCKIHTHIQLSTLLPLSF